MTMPSRPVIEARTASHAIATYLAACRQRHTVVEVEGAEVAHVPPTVTETRELLAYLRTHGLDAVVVGSVGVLHHLGAAGRNFRPTADLDLFVSVSQKALRRITPPVGWRVDMESPGVVSWISPAGGYVDFLTAGHTFPSGETTPSSVARDPHSPDDLPVAAPVELFRLKLSSMRSRDLSDLHELAQTHGLPSDAELGRLNPQQKENLDLLKLWLKARK
jgi:hypothetical protein